MVFLGLELLLAANTNSVVSNAACTLPDTPAALVAAPLLPAIVQSMGDHGNAQLIVTLTPGATHPSNVLLVRSSGNSIADAAVIETTRASEFSPEKQNCASVSGRYYYDVEF